MLTLHVLASYSILDLHSKYFLIGLKIEIIRGTKKTVHVIQEVCKVEKDLNYDNGFSVIHK